MGRNKGGYSASERTQQLTGATLISTLMLTGLLTFSTQSNAQIQFQDVTNNAGPFHTGESWGASWCDINGDRYPDLYVSNHGMKTSIYRNNGGNSFTDIIETADADQVLYKPGDIGTIEADLHGASCADWDNDGDQDIFATRSSAGTTVFLLKNVDGNGTFRERRGAYTLNGSIGGGRLPVHMDYNNDGKTDVAIAKNDSSMLQLFKQQSNNKFTNTTSAEGITQQCSRNFFGFPTRLFDDEKQLYFCMQPAKVPEKVYDTSVSPFADVTNKIDNVGIYSDATMADFNNDLRNDMIVIRGKNRPNGVKRINNQRIEAWVTADGQERVMKFKSTGNITVNLHSRTVATKSNTTGTYQKIYIGGSGMNPSTGGKFPVIELDPNLLAHQGVRSNRNPGGAYMGYNTSTQEWNIYLTSDLVYFVIKGQDFTIPTLSGLTGSDKDIKPTFLFNDGNRLTNAGSRGVDAITCNSVIAEDFDNDMDVDIYVGCSNSVENLGNRFYWNNGNGSFSGGGGHGAQGIIGAGVANSSGTTETVVAADYNVDGFIDILATQGNRIFPHNRKDGFTGGGPDQLFKNIANNGNKWIEIDLRGVTSTRDGFGTKVIVTAGGVSQLREQDGRYHRWSHDHRRLHFGLKNNGQANVRVEWPDGTIDIHNNVSANKLYEAVQDGGLVDITPGTPPPAGKQININSVVVAEADGNAALNVSLSETSTTAVSVNFATANGSAQAGSDYTTNSGTVTFQPGQVSKVVNIAILDDGNSESVENFNVNLSNASGATIGQGSGSVTINDDDNTGGNGNSCGNPNYNPATDQGVFVWQDCAGDGRWHVHGTGGGGSPQTYTGGITSDAGISNVQPISMEASDSLVSSTQSINFTMNTGSVWHDGFSFNVNSGTTCMTLDTPSGAQIYVGGAKTQVGSTFNIETLGACQSSSPGVNLTINNRSATENGGTVVMNVRLSAASSSIVRVNYATANGTAIAGSDYVARNGRITFQPGQTEKTATITLINDANAENPENFTVNLSNATGGALISQSTGTVTLSDDD